MQRILLLIILLFAAPLFALQDADAAAENAETAAETMDTAKATETPAVPPELPRVAAIGRNQQAITRLAQQYPHEFVELAGEQEAYAALYLPANSKEALGLAVLLPGTQQPADTRGALGLLRHALPDKGWHSLMLNLPDPDFEPLYISPLPQPPASEPELAPDQLSDDELLPLVSAAAESAADDAATQVPGAPEDETPALPAEQAQVVQSLPGTEEPQEPDYVSRLGVQLDLALARAQEQNAALLLIAAHDSAHLLLQYLHDNPQQGAQLAHVILFEPQQSAAASGTLAGLVEQLPLPVTEFYTAASRTQQEQARQRLNAGKRKTVGSYQQIRLDALLPDQAGQANRRIAGWIYKNL